MVEKQINEGMYVDTGTEIYTIADLSRLWLYLDAYESDLPWIRYGQQVVFRAEAFPGEEFHGVVSFVQPFLDERTRTVRVRVNVENPDLRLKPGLFVTATIQAQISGPGNRCWAFLYWPVYLPHASGGDTRGGGVVVPFAV